ncbi:Acyl-CoA N-acyltransferase [Penicillium canescens]|uniref:Acyl-CoA N-acyltransferase n=1 Tax=Penicillium canescens TaxID=5083 RepID=A0AAD6IBQ0_PENCN|nr:Acyl-CoA N-acyltransferase [Penicillium canescens]KAJ6041599.1 Acyl-CoA N-acyltransferase [Penicillium canescens]KAJ6050408.1 Acyl-CoA N-acyltransferase [Penicillium canescens]KAJ6064712.1 Acyl-CoA N-acyltransferase [Penicillium canescens]
MAALKPQIYQHDIGILTHLAAQLPSSIALLRRIQHGIAYPSSTARILATFPPGSSPTHSQPWLAARVDLFRSRETQIFLYSSLEAEHTSTPTIFPFFTDPAHQATKSSGAGSAPGSINTSLVASSLTATPDHLDVTREQLLNMLLYIKTNLLPDYLASLSAMRSIGAISSPVSNYAPSSLDPKAFLIGSLHTGLFTLLLRSGTFAHPIIDADVDLEPYPGLKVHRFDSRPYLKYLFRQTRLNSKTSDGAIPLPKGYRYCDKRGRFGVLYSQLDLIQSRTHIPRSKEQLLSIPSVVVYHDSGKEENMHGWSGSSCSPSKEKDEMPIAWAFLGLDGALATLHVEPGHRGQGLAPCLSVETMRRGMDLDGIFSAKGENEEVQNHLREWVHADVAQYNMASRRVMEKVGGEVLSTVMWTVIELCD